MNKILFFILFFFYLSTSASIANADTAEEIKVVVLNNIKYAEAEDITASMSTIHSQSPVYESTQKILAQMFPIYDLKYKILSYNFISVDEEYAYVRISQQTRKINGPDFNNNILDAIQVFKKEEGLWKLWTQANLSINFESGNQ